MKECLYKIEEQPYGEISCSFGRKTCAGCKEKPLSFRGTNLVKGKYPVWVAVEKGYVYFHDSFQYPTWEVRIHMEGEELPYSVLGNSSYSIGLMRRMAAAIILKSMQPKKEKKAEVVVPQQLNLL